MNLSVIIPVKPLHLAKSRLAGTLTPSLRAELAETMLRQVLRVVAKVRGVQQTVLITRDPQVLAIGRAAGVQTLRESDPSDLNRALSVATSVVMRQGAEATLILPADLPFLTPTDVRQLIRLGEGGAGIVIAPDDQHAGTNALLMRPAGLFTYAYGQDSFQQHLALAQQRGVSVQVYESDTLALDIDVPEDLALYNQRVLAGLSTPYLHPFYPSPRHA